MREADVTQTRRSRWTEAIVISLITGIVTAGSAPWWWPPAHRGLDHLLGHETTAFSGGCGGYQLYAQNRWNPVGASIRRAPDPLSAKVGGFGANEIVAVNGWIHAKVTYPNNPSPWDSDVWFHLADNRGWISFAGLRAAPSDYDPTGRSANGGIAPATTASCEGRLG
jgi:hypothetical protein